MVNEKPFLWAWQVLEERGWHAFTIDAVAVRHPQLKKEEWEILFPRREEVVWAMTEYLSTHTDDLTGLSLQDGLFEMIMGRFEALEPYRKGIVELILFGGMKLNAQIALRVRHSFKGQLSKAYPRLCASTWSFVAFGIYASHLLVWVAQGGEPLMASLWESIQKIVAKMGPQGPLN